MAKYVGFTVKWNDGNYIRTEHYVDDEGKIVRDDVSEITVQQYQGVAIFTNRMVKSGLMNREYHDDGFTAWEIDRGK